MITTINGRRDIRPLGLEDSEHSPLPYAGLGRLHKSVSIVRETLGTINYTAADDWGTGLDFYFSGFTYRIAGVGVWGVKKGPFIKVHEPITGNLFFMETANQTRLLKYARITANAVTTVQFANLRKVLSTETIRFDILNLSTTNINFIMTMQGIPITP